MHTSPRVAPALRQVGPLTVRAQSADDTVDEILGALRRDEVLSVAFANAHLLYCALQNPELGTRLRSFLVLNDGVAMALCARLSANSGFPENLNGTDFVPRLLKAAPDGARIYLLGAKPHVVAKAARKLEASFPRLLVCGARHGYSLELEDVLIGLEQAAPDIVLVAMGNPLQEEWICHCAPHLKRGVLLGVGAFLDFLAEESARAPLWIRQSRLEWAHRLVSEPTRLWRRYTLELAVVFTALLRERMRRNSHARAAS